MDSAAPDLDRVVALFNAGEFFACHEAWEVLWKVATGRDREFHQGMIQAAVAVLHAERRNRRGALAVYRKAAARLAPLPATYQGIAVEEFRRALAEFFANPVFTQLDSGTRLPPRPRIRVIAHAAG